MGNRDDGSVFEGAASERGLEQCIGLDIHRSLRWKLLLSLTLHATNQASGHNDILRRLDMTYRSLIQNHYVCGCQ